MIFGILFDIKIFFLVICGHKEIRKYLDNTHFSE